MTAACERHVDVDAGVRLWAQAHGDAALPTLLLVMGANASGLTWPDALVGRLAEHHHVVRYDHRDTGRSTHAFDERPYPISVLAGDALAVLDAFGVARAHVVGMSLGGVLVQVLALDAPERLLTATVLATGALEVEAGEEVVPGPTAEVLALWQHLGEARDREAEAAFQVEHWRVLSGASMGGVFDEAEVRALEERLRRHSGRDRRAVAHALADASGLARGAELARVRTPLLVVEAPLDPVFPPPNARHLAGLVPGARLVTIPRLGHALPAELMPALAGAILVHTGAIPA